MGLGIEASFRLLKEWNPGKSLLLVGLRIANRSDVLYRHSEATATLMDARKETVDGRVRLVPFKSADPMPPVYGDISQEVEAISRGTLFHLGKSKISLEPGEVVDSEIAFVLDSTKLGLMGLRVLIQGRQRKRFFKRPYWWGAFFFVPTSHEGLESGNAMEWSGSDETR